MADSFLVQSQTKSPPHSSLGVCIVIRVLFRALQHYMRSDGI